MAERERFTTTIDGQLLEDIKILAIRKRCSANDLMEEAIRDLLNKYEDKKQSERKIEPSQERSGQINFGEVNKDTQGE